MKLKHGFIFGASVFLFLIIVLVVLNKIENGKLVELAVKNISQSSTVQHVQLPSEVRGIYWNATTAGSQRGDELLSYMKEYGLNSVVIDLKMDNGDLAFNPTNESLKQYVSQQPTITDFDALLKRLYEKDIYRIARIAIMRDGRFAKTHPEVALSTSKKELWRDKTGEVWLDPSADIVSDYAVALAYEAYSRGFDEIQFDYLRFASDGEIKSIVYPFYKNSETKVDVIQKLFKKIGTAMSNNHIPVSFDLFGMTFWTQNGYTIGQRLVDVFPYANFVSPMVYPSHFPNGFKGYPVPAEVPYEIIKRSLDEGTKIIRGIFAGSEKELRTRWRPWLQDFDIGAVYTSEKIEAQIQAARDAGASGWILWNARNEYEPANYIFDDANSVKSDKGETLLVHFPSANSVVSSPMTVSGSARGSWYFEAIFPVVLTNWDGLIISEGQAVAKSDWMTSGYVPFEATLNFDIPKGAQTGQPFNRGFLILHNSNPSGLPEYDDAVEIPVFFK